MDAKICGIKNPKTLNYIINHEYPPKFVGFIANYPKSKRFLKFEDLKQLVNINKKNINFVCVLVDPDDLIIKKIKELNFDYLQLYKVSPKRTKIIKENLNIKIITLLQLKILMMYWVTKITKKFLILYYLIVKVLKIWFDRQLLDNVPNL